LGEIAYTDGNLVPELSFGTHFFHDLVETDIFYFALFPDNPAVFFNTALFNEFGETLEKLYPDGHRLKDVLKVYDVAANNLKIVADIVKQQLICFL